MNLNFTVLFYVTQDGKCPVQEFLNSRSEENKKKIYAWIEQLEKDGPNLPRPYADLLQNGIHELRIKLSGEQVRILYFFCYEKNIILTHSFIKKEKIVQRSEIKRAIKAREDFLSRIKKEDIEL